MTRVSLALGTLVLGLAVLLGGPALAPAGPCDNAPATVARTVENKTNSFCDAGCGVLRNLGMSGPVAADTGIRGGGRLRYVDQWQGECQISGGPLNGQCKAPTTCPPGHEKVADGGVWKCRFRTTAQVPNPARAECEARAAAAVAKAAATPPASPALKQIASLIAKGRPQGEILDRWKTFVESARAAGSPVDVNALIQQVLRESAREQQEDLRFHQDKLRRFHEQKAALRDEIQKLREGKVGGAQRELVVARDRAAQQLKQLEEKLNTVGDDAQLANIDLQNTLQQQQQALQMLSNISKQMHDTAMAIIRNIGG